MLAHPPPDMRDGCEAFIEGWEQEIEKALITRGDNVDQTVYKLCTQVTRACDGVDPSNVQPFDNEIWVDGQPKKIVF